MDGHSIWVVAKRWREPLVPQPMRAKLKEIKKELRRRMHQPIFQQGNWLKLVVTGYFAYHAVPTNSRALHAFRYHVIDLWRRSLKRRSQKDRTKWDQHHEAGGRLPSSTPHSS